MKVLVMNQFYWPDSAATSQLLTDVTVALAEDGHEVSAICADSGYAVSTDTMPPPVRIHRIKTLPFSRNVLGRVLSYLSFYVAAAVRGLTLPKHDVVLTLTTPPLLSLIGTLIGTVRGSRQYIWEMDVYPDVAIDLHYFKAGGIADRVVGALADFSRRRADGVIALGECMKERLMRRGIPAKRIFVAENWADASAIVPLNTPGLQAPLTVLYSGNLGLAHDVDTIAGAMLQLRADPRFRFVFVGGGGRTKELSDFSALNNIQSIEFRPYAQRSSLSESLCAGDIGLVTQRDDCCGSVVPSKVYGLLAAGRPILFIGPQEATPGRIIERYGCGWRVACGDIAALAALLERLANHPEEIQEAGRRARLTSVAHYDRPLGIARIAGILELNPPLSVAAERSGVFTHPKHRPSPVAYMGPIGSTEKRL